MPHLILPKEGLLDPTTKPLVPCAIDWNHPLSIGLVACWLIGENGGNRLTDMVNRTQLSIGTASWDRDGLRCDADSEGAETTTPPHMRIAKSVSIVCGIYNIGTPGLWGPFAGMRHNNTNASPYASCNLSVNDHASRYYNISYNRDGTFTSMASTTPVTPGYHNICGTVKTGDQKIYLNGVQIASSTLTFTDILYGATSLVFVGAFTGWVSNTNSIIRYSYIYNRALNAGEVLILHSAPYCFIKPILPYEYYYPAAAPTGIPKHWDYYRQMRARA